VSAACDVLAAGGATDDPYLARVIQAKHIWSATGRAIDPWEVDDYPPDWLEAVCAHEVEVPKRREKVVGAQRR